MSGERESPRSGQLWLLGTEGQQRRDVVAEVAIEARTTRLHTYAVPESLQAALRPGVAVVVPYGRHGRTADGICVRVARGAWDHTRQPILSVSSVERLLSGNLLKLGLWISEYYFCPPGLVLSAFVPAAVRKPRLRKVAYVRLAGGAPGKTPTAKQQAIMTALGGGEARRVDALKAAGAGASTLRTLVRAGLVEQVVRLEPDEPAKDRDGAPLEPGASACPEDSFKLTAGQRTALDAVNAAGAAGTFQVLLLFGVPGSGKTEVYVRAIRAVIRAGRQAILLVPEIALATQVVARLARRFERVAVLHSRLTPRVRRRTHRAIAAGDVDVIIGTRTAVFAPCPRVGLIVVDEEQDSSFKSLAAPFFCARDVAIKRGQIEGAPVVLGSATPALETWHNARTLPHFRLLRLPQRVPGARPPEVRLVPTTPRALGQTTNVLSPELSERLRDTLRCGRQAILLHNRRGYAVHLRCTACGLTVRCRHCGAHLVYHRADGAVRCHRCGLKEQAPRRCLDDTCAGRLERSGLAIQRLEEELRRALPRARLLRLDSDTMRHREDYRAALQRFEARQADILLGTQMVAKGLDFPHVDLVGVIDADAGLRLPDFRAGERVFQLLVQVVGRAGRREGDSLALVQCDDPATPAIRHGLRMDYEAFAAAELEVRRQLFDPPFARIIRCICADPRSGRARQAAGRLSEQLRTLAGRVSAAIRVADAEPCVIARLREMFRYQVIVRAPRDAGVPRLLREAANERLLSPRVRRFTVDVDPLDMF